MDFRTCSACKASILEDDVDDCPFCGASLSGKSAKPKAPAPAAGTKPAAKPTGTKPAGKPATTASKAASAKPAATRRTDADDEGEDADPFEVDTSAVRDAHPISPKRTKTTPVPVTCPMCETSGFISPRLAGKEVKCCNPDCMVPVFKAPPLPKKEEVVVETPQGMTMASKITMGVMGLMLLIGAGIIYSMVTGGDDGDDVVVTNPTHPVNDDNGDPPDPENPGEETPAEAAGPKYTLDFIQTESLAEMARQAQRTSDNRSPPFGRQMVAETHFILGDDSSGREELVQLRGASRGKLYFDIAPLAELAWRHFEQGDDAAANAVLDEAMAASVNLPTVSRQSLDDASLLCAALGRAERWEDALGIVRQQRTLEPRGRTSALWRGALEFKSFDFSEEFDRPYLMGMPDSLSVAITRTMCARGAWDEAWTWTTKVDGEDVRHNCQAAWAAAVTITAHRSGDAELLTRLDAAIAAGDPVGQARMWAAIADGHLLAEKTAEAEAALASAVAALQAVPTPPVAEVPSMRAIHDSRGRPFEGLTDPAPFRSLGLAWADVGHMHVALGHSEEAGAAFASGVAAMRGAVPSPVATQALVNECRSQETEVKSRLAAAGVSDASRTGFFQYRGQCEALHQLAARRFEEQVALLMRAANLGLVEEAWQIVHEGDSSELPANEREPWRTSSIPARIIGIAGRAGNQAIIDDITSTITPPPRPTSLDRLHYFLLGVNSGTTIQQISDEFSKYYSDSSVDEDALDAVFLKTVSTVHEARGLAPAIELAGKAGEARPPVVEDAFRLLSSLAVVSGKQDEIWDAYLRQRGKLSVTEKVAVFRGLIDGILVVRRNETP
jgi:hypothetical protein